MSWIEDAINPNPFGTPNHPKGVVVSMGSPNGRRADGTPYTDPMRRCECIYCKPEQNGLPKCGVCNSFLSERKFVHCP